MVCTVCGSTPAAPCGGCGNVSYCGKVRYGVVVCPTVHSNVGVVMCPTMVRYVW